MATTKQPALEIRNVYFSYKNGISILNGINVTVPKGGIYGLLGSSGCGKTTLLKCTLGRLEPNSGSVSLFGHKPGSPQSKVPGPGVGYMPQELALYEEFTIEEILIYFGRLFGIKSKVVDSRIEFLVDLLQLPDKRQLISKLSGGQKRRVSIATALLHNPPLLILDEPTVGLDLILREAIWKHLEFLCQNGLTVIVTTHYIEEARSALKVGFMRSGKLLAEGSPDELLRLNGFSTLEAVFLKLSQNQDKQKSNKKVTFNCNSNELHFNSKDQDFPMNDMNSHKTGDPKLVNVRPINANINGYANNGYIHDIPNEVIPVSDGLADIDSKLNNNIDPGKDYVRKKSFSNGLIQLRLESVISDTNFIYRLMALILKNFKQISRNIGLLAFFILLPSIEIILIMKCVGQNIQHIPVGVYNPEKSTDLSEMFLKSIDKKFISLVRYKTLDEAIDAVKVNDVWAVIYFNKTFSESLVTRVYFSSDDDEVINASSIQLRIDMSNQVIGTQVFNYISQSYMTFIDNLSKKFKANMNAMKPLINNGPPIYGQQSPSFNTFVSPGALIVVAYFATTTITCHLLIKERTDGLVDRNLVAGVKPLEFVLSHIILQLFMLLLQVGLMLILGFVVFYIPINGSIISASLMVYLQGVCGLMFGLMVSALCPDEIYATTLCIGAFFPTVILGGLFWPLESMPPALQYISQLMPSTLAIDSLRSILLRGWDLSYSHVIIGFVTTGLWLLFFGVSALTFFVKRL